MTPARTSDVWLWICCAAAGFIAFELTYRFLTVSAFRLELARL